MFIPKTTIPTFVSALMLSSTLCSTAYADLTREILQGIASGTRTIRPEIKSLKKIPVPEASNLAEFVINKQKAIELGKALFWDVQVSVDGVQACASCHFNAGAENRAKNTLSPGLRITDQFAKPLPDFTFSPGKDVNYHLQASDFPFHLKVNPNLFTSRVLRDTNDVVSPQGIHFSLLDRVRQRPVPSLDPDGYELSGFNTPHVNTRRVSSRNAPSVINAVFNYRNLWDGRANNIFNGVNPFGDNSPDAVVYKLDPLDFAPKQTRVRINNASLASQATGSPLNDFEMSTRGQNWLDIGDRLILNAAEGIFLGKDIIFVTPLGRQKVHPQDSVLGPLTVGVSRGLNGSTYSGMISRAFDPKWWQAIPYIKVNRFAKPTIISKKQYLSLLDKGLGKDVYSQMEFNFSLFFGLAIYLYESTLVSDDSPVDRYLDGDLTALNQSELVGFHLADDEARCLNCHGGGEFTFASVSRINKRGLTRIRRGDLIDEGFNNIGVRPTLEDLGVGGRGPFGNPFGFARRTHLGLFNNDKIPGIADELAADLANDGAFKIPTLRNVELTAPYFHNGGESTLEDVIDFYFRGGNFRTFNEAERHPIIGYDAERFNETKITGLGVLRGPLLNSGPGLDDVDKANLVAFLKALTDERVRFRKAPFDHPQLFVPDGHRGDHRQVFEDSSGNAIDILREIPAVGRNGGPPLSTFLENILP